MTVLTTLGLQQSIRNGWGIAALFYINHPDGEVWAWTGIGNIDYGGETYQGVGRFVSVGSIGGSRQLKVKSIEFLLRGVTPEMLVGLSSSVRNRSAKAWLAGMTENGKRINGAPWLIVDGVCDYQEAKFEGSKGAIRLMISEPVWSIERAQNLAWTPEWLNETFQTDSPTLKLTGLDFLTELVDAEKSWTKT